MKIILQNEFALFYDSSLNGTLLTREGKTVVLKYEVYVLSDLGDFFLQEIGSVGMEDLSKEVTAGSRGVVWTENGKKMLITKDFKKRTRYGRHVNQLIGEPFDRDFPSRDSRIWRAKLNRNVSEIKDGMRFNLCRGADNVWFLLR